MPKPPSKAELAGCRVLVVEDELLVAMEMEHLLTELGCRVVGPVPSVARALALLDQDSPDIAVLDVQLGSERATPIGEKLKERGIPFLLVTGYGRLELKEPVLCRAPRLGKPVEAKEVARMLGHLVLGQPSPA